MSSRPVWKWSDMWICVEGASSRGAQKPVYDPKQLIFAVVGSWVWAEKPNSMRLPLGRLLVHYTYSVHGWEQQSSTNRKDAVDRIQEKWRMAADDLGGAETAAGGSDYFG
ncbi:hypothetical protein L2E82_20080 [Cichorium intybus]|uniref:Uncharacterized protein n=1 Tax=Cichorium intybus TaxID=13427 RepID=A0ACB9DS10_CICIN|nr:hypothetical protein L2E82_20080 [Cichorium intybus]